MSVCFLNSNVLRSAVHAKSYLKWFVFSPSHGIPPSVINVLSYSAFSNFLTVMATPSSEMSVQSHQTTQYDIETSSYSSRWEPLTSQENFRSNLDSKKFLPYSRGELSYLAPLGSENISSPYFKQCFFQGGYYPPDCVKHHASQSQDRNNKYFILYIEFVAADLLFRLARMRHAWRGDCYLNVLVFSWQILFLLS